MLPISSTAKVLVTGPNSNSMRTLNGGWSYSWQGEKTEMFASKYNTIYRESIASIVKEVDLLYKKEIYVFQAMNLEFWWFDIETRRAYFLAPHWF